MFAKPILTPIYIFSPILLSSGMTMPYLRSLEKEEMCSSLKVIRIRQIVTFIKHCVIRRFNGLSLGKSVKIYWFASVNPVYDAP